MLYLEVNQQSGKKITKSWFEKNIKKALNILKVKGRTELSIALIGDRAMGRLNKIYRGQDKVTDVLSFNYKPILLGEIIICYPQAVRQARRQKHSVKKEIKILLIHGLLHLLGYDHKKKKEAEKMQNLEKKVLSKINKY